MVRPIDWISTDSETEPLKIPRLSIGQFSNHAVECLSQIEEVKQRLVRISGRFKSNGTILPFICKEALSVLDELRNYTDQFCELLSETDRLPLIFVALRHDILYELCNVKEQIRRLEVSIENYRIICMSSPQISQRKLIYNSFQNIFKYIAEATRQFKLQSEVARFQERKLISIYEEA
jgi:hypothetical protein